MIWMLLVLIILWCIYLILDYRNKYVWIISTYYLGIMVMQFASMLLVAKVSTYPIRSGFDSKMHIFLLNIKLNTPDISRLYNFGLCLLLLISVILFINVRKNGWLRFVILILPIIGYAYALDPNTTYSLYTIGFLQEKSSGKWLLYHILNFINTFSGAIVIIYMILPFIGLIHSFRKTKIYLKKKNSVIMIIALLLMDIYLYLVFVIGPFGKFFANKISFFKFPVTAIDWSNYSYQIYISLAILLVMAAILMLFKPYNKFRIVSPKESEKNSKLLNKNLRMIFHVYKNLFFAIDKYTEQIKYYIETDIEKSKQIVDKIGEVSYNSTVSISKMLDLLRDSKTTYEVADINICVKEALASVDIPGTIEMELTETNGNIFVFADKFQIKEAFANVLNNAVEAIHLKGEEGGRISIDINQEEDLVAVEIRDNGCGIKKENIKRIFDPFFSTKQSTKNWGIGLNSVSKVFRLHNGDIYVRSIENEYTVFQMVLPVYVRRGLRG